MTCIAVIFYLVANRGGSLRAWKTMWSILNGWSPPRGGNRLCRWMIQRTRRTRV